MRPLLHLALALAITGCAAAANDVGAAASGVHGGSLGIVQIERAATVDPALSADRAVVGAAFARYRGMDGRSVLGLLGGRSAELGACALAGQDPLALDSLDAEVELLDVGELLVEVAGTEARIMPRTFPDVAGLVSGAFYAEDAALGAARADLDEYRIRARGYDVAAFDGVAIAPAGFAEVLLDGRAVVDLGYLDRGADLSVVWDAGDPRDRVYIDIAAGGVVLECTARDDGSFRLSGEALSGLPEDANARFVLRRVRSVPLDVEGIDAAWITVASIQSYDVPLH